MDVRRRDFVKGCAASVLLLAGIDSATKEEKLNGALASGIDLHIEKSIKASFGDGFSVRGYTQLDGLTYADIEHFGNRHVIASEDLLDWKIVRPSLSKLRFASSSISGWSLSLV